MFPFILSCPVIIIVGSSKQINIIGIAMGNSSHQEARKSYVPISGKLQHLVGHPKYVLLGKSGIQLEEFLVNGAYRSTETESQIYTLRSSSLSHSLVIVFDHFIMVEQQKVFLVQVEKMATRLSQIGQVLSEVQALCFLEGALNGFNQLLRHSKVPFGVNENMIGLNEKSRVRVWCNENFAVNRIQDNGTVKSQSVMINQLAAHISKHVRNSDIKEFQNLRISLAQYFTLHQAKLRVSYILGAIQRKKILVTLRQNLMRQQVGNTNEGTLNVNSLQKASLTPEKQRINKEEREEPISLKRKKIFNQKNDKRTQVNQPENFNAEDNRKKSAHIFRHRRTEIVSPIQFYEEYEKQQVKNRLTVQQNHNNLPAKVSVRFLDNQPQRTGGNSRPRLFRSPGPQYKEFNGKKNVSETSRNHQLIVDNVRKNSSEVFFKVSNQPQMLRKAQNVDHSSSFVIKITPPKYKGQSTHQHQIGNPLQRSRKLLSVNPEKRHSIFNN